MNYPLKFLQTHPDIVRNMEAVRHNSPYHLEGSIWTHTLMVYTYVKALHPDNKVLLLSALLHDIGKFEAYSVEDGKTRFFGHEGYSTFMAREVLKDEDCTRQELIDILNVISLHGVNTEQLQDIPYLTLFRKADVGGRISEKETTDYAPRKFIKPCKEPEHTVTILVGLPCSGKSTFAKTLNCKIISRDDELVKFSPGKDQDESYTNLRENPELKQKFDNYFNSYLDKASKAREDLVIDMTMLSLSDRRRMMGHFPKAQFKCVILLPSLDLISERNKSRIGKTINEGVYTHMMQKFVMPVKAEGFIDIKYILE